MIRFNPELRRTDQSNQKRSALHLLSYHVQLDSVVFMCFGFLQRILITMNWLIAFAVIVVVQATPSLKTRFDAFSDQLIHYVNEKSGASWRAARSTRFNRVEHMKQHLGALVETPEQRKSRRPTMRYQVSDSDLPESFDTRKQWPSGPSISEIRDQSGCAASWVSVPVERVC
ncbi:Cathepsin B4 [Fasciola hepatica]|uniref:Cathepsin B4 n=1 Tax=Fasciola hepatica TaxID=6192 RepID=A0A4E0RVE4_FASHE|nr:Cathepsin B4 [Fasciola hepatica]